MFRRRPPITAIPLAHAALGGAAIGTGVGIGVVVGAVIVGKQIRRVAGETRRGVGMVNDRMAELGDELETLGSHLFDTRTAVETMTTGVCEEIEALGAGPVKELVDAVQDLVLVLTPVAPEPVPESTRLVDIPMFSEAAVANAKAAHPAGPPEARREAFVEPGEVLAGVPDDVLGAEHEADAESGIRLVREAVADFEWGG